MNEDELERRWHAAEQQIQDLHASKVVDGDPADVEGRPLEVQGALEYEIGLLQFKAR